MLSCGLSYFFLALVAAVVAVGCSPADNEVAASDPWAISRDGTRPVVELVVPTFNEADRMPLSDFRAFVARNDNNSSFGPVFQLLFVNDGSTDDTLAHLQRIRGPHVRILNLDENVGKAEAVRLGLRHSLLGDDGLMASSIPDFVGFWDADLATPLDEVFTFMQVFQQHPRLEMILGSRVALLGRNISRRAERHYLGRIFATGASMVLGLPVYDTQCGAKLFRASKDLIAMIAEPFQSRWIFDVELLARFVRLRERSVLALQPVNVIYEQPLARWEDIPGSKLNLKSKVCSYGALSRVKKLTLSIIGVLRVFIQLLFDKCDKDNVPNANILASRGNVVVTVDYCQFFFVFFALHCWTWPLNESCSRGNRLLRCWNCLKSCKTTSCHGLHQSSSRRQMMLPPEQTRVAFVGRCSVPSLASLSLGSPRLYSACGACALVRSNNVQRAMRNQADDTGQIDPSEQTSSGFGWDATCYP